MEFTQKKVSVTFGGEEKEILRKAYLIIDELYTRMDGENFYDLIAPDGGVWSRDDEILDCRTLLEDIADSEINEKWEME